MSEAVLAYTYVSRYTHKVTWSRLRPDEKAALGRIRAYTVKGSFHV